MLRYLELRVFKVKYLNLKNLLNNKATCIKSTTQMTKFRKRLDIHKILISGYHIGLDIRNEKGKMYLKYLLFCQKASSKTKVRNQFCFKVISLCNFFYYYYFYTACIVGEVKRNLFFVRQSFMSHFFRG